MCFESIGACQAWVKQDKRGTVLLMLPALASTVVPMNHSLTHSLREDLKEREEKKQKMEFAASS